MTATTLRLTLGPADGALLLEALAELPFKQVYRLIGELDRQAQRAFGAGGDGQFDFEPDQLRLALAALGGLPHRRVDRLLHSMHGQMRSALAAAPRCAGVHG